MIARSRITSVAASSCAVASVLALRGDPADISVTDAGITLPHPARRTNSSAGDRQAPLQTDIVQALRNPLRFEERIRMAFFRLFFLQADWLSPLATVAQGVMLAAILAASLVSDASAAERTPTTNLKTIVFVCEHGSVRSVVAAAHFNRIARERGLPFVAVSRGINIDDRIPASVRDGLARDGLAPTEEAPHELRADEAADAAQVIAFDTVPAERSGGADVTYWRNLPPMLKDYEGGRAAIVRHVEDAANALKAK